MPAVALGGGIRGARQTVRSEAVLVSEEKPCHALISAAFSLHPVLFTGANLGVTEHHDAKVPRTTHRKPSRGGRQLLISADDAKSDLSQDLLFAGQIIRDGVSSKCLELSDLFHSNPDHLPKGIAGTDLLLRCTTEKSFKRALRIAQHMRKAQHGFTVQPSSSRISYSLLIYAIKEAGSLTYDILKATRLPRRRERSNE